MTLACCRFDGHPLQDTFVDLGMSPLSNAFLSASQINEAETFYPLHTYVCAKCLLVQLEQFETPSQIFSDYAYFSSYSASWLRHAEEFAASAAKRFGLDARHQVVEIGSNDGYLLQYFQRRGIPVLGIDPAANVAQEALRRGIPTRTAFFGVEAAQRLVDEAEQADLLIGNNVLAHVPDLNDFVAGLKLALKPTGTLSIEFPHLLQLMENSQFDTIYHEHFSYFSLLTVEKIFAAHGLTLFDVDELPTHGGSLRIYGAHADALHSVPSERIAALRAREIAAGLDQLTTYFNFGSQVHQTKRRLLEFLICAKDTGHSVAAYGAPAKGNTLLNYCGIRTDFIDYAVDLSPHKQGRFLPGTHIPIYHPDRVKQTKPDFLLLLPWNLKEEIMQQMAYVREWGGRFVVPIPSLKIYD